jgi:hypothetical protein
MVTHWLGWCLQVAAGSFSNLYRGYYCGQEVAVKILKELQDDASQFQEFLQEVSIMRKVRSSADPVI